MREGFREAGPEPDFARWGLARGTGRSSDRLVELRHLEEEGFEEGVGLDRDPLLDEAECREYVGS